MKAFSLIKRRKGKKARLRVSALIRGGGHNNQGRVSKELVFLIIRVHVLVIALIGVLWSRSKLKSGSAITQPFVSAESGAQRKAKVIVRPPASGKPVPGGLAPGGPALESAPAKPAAPSKAPQKSSP